MDFNGRTGERYSWYNGAFDVVGGHQLEVWSQLFCLVLVEGNQTERH